MKSRERRRRRRRGTQHLLAQTVTEESFIDPFFNSVESTASQLRAGHHLRFSHIREKRDRERGGKSYQLN
jgi:hypothetical protein